MRALARGVGCGSLAAALFLAPGQARAAASAHLVYVRGPGAEDCPSEAAVHAAVGARLGYDPFFAWAHDTLFAEITRADGAFHVDLRLVDDHNLLRGARQISVAGADCAAAIDAMGLTVSLTIDPSSLVNPPPARPVTPPSPMPDVEPEGAPPSPPPPQPPRELEAAPQRETDAHASASAPQSLFGHVGLGALGSVGAAPAATVGTVLFAGLSWRALSLDLEGRADLHATGAGQETSARVRSWLVTGSVVPCAHWGVSFGCLVLSGGSLGATSVGTAAPRTDHAPWWAVGLRAGAEIPVRGSLFLRVYAELLATTTPDALSIDGAVAYAFSPWSGGLGADVAWRFP